VVYEQFHTIPPLSEVVTPAQWCSYCKMWMQNEGYAVYAPLRLQQKLGHLAERDYRVILDPAELERHKVALFDVLERLHSNKPLSKDEYLDSCFGSKRLTYRMGCELIRRIEVVSGIPAVREAFYMDGDTFIEKYNNLLELSL